MTFTATAASRKTAAQAMLFMAVFSVVCHWAIVPLAAWNHNLLLVIVAALAPMALIAVLRATGKIPAVKIESASRRKSIITLVVRTAVVTFLIWNHLWLVAVVAVVVMSFLRTKVTVKK